MITELAGFQVNTMEVLISNDLLVLNGILVYKKELEVTKQSLLFNIHY